MKQAVTLLLLLTGAQAWAMDPPEMDWEMQYQPNWYSQFIDIDLLNDDDMIVAGNVWTGISGYTLIKMSSDGTPFWIYGEDWYSQQANDVEELSDSSFIVTGTCKDQSTSSFGLFVARVDASGVGNWAHIYDPSEGTEAGYRVVSLFDGGVAVSGRVNGTGLENGQAYILRLDSQGDTLWTDVWGTHAINFSKGILYNNGKLVVLVHGSGPGLPYGAHLLFYDLDGNYLYGTSYPGVGGHASAMCLAQDGGYTFVTDPEGPPPAIVHTDSLGNLLWSNSILSGDLISDETWSSVSTCMDGGYIVAGSRKYLSQPSDDPSSALSPGSDWDRVYGWLVRIDQAGQQQWEVLLFPGSTDPVELFSARQLAEGGYIASGYYNDVSGGTGINGYIVRYAPETGIGEWETTSRETATLSAWPNPSDGPVRISLTGPEGLYDLGIYDLQGRLVRDFPEVPLGGGAVLLWDGCSGAGASLPGGVYIARLIAADGAASTLMMRPDPDTR